MSHSPEDQSAFLRCRNCGEILTGGVARDGSVYPVGVGSDGKCGDADFEVLTMSDPSPPEGTT